MTCVHLKQLYQLCDKYHLKLSSSDLIRITCPECGLQETCPSVHVEENAGSETATTPVEEHPVDAPSAKTSGGP
jgi:hypothetical protein